MTNELSAPRVPASRSVVERETKRIVTRHVSLLDEVDTLINEILDSDQQDRWILHANPAFDDESSEGSVDVDKIRLADMVRTQAMNNPLHYPQVLANHTHRISQAVQRALSRTGESVNQRRNRVHEATAA